MTNEQQPADQCVKCGDTGLIWPSNSADNPVRCACNPTDQGRGVGDAQLCAMTKVLQDAWAKAEPNHGVTLYPASYVASFVDMARAAIAALTQPKGELSDADIQRAWDAYNDATDKADASEAGSLMDRMHAGMKAALGTASLPRQSEAVKCEFCGEFTPINEQLIVYGKELSELMDACDQYLTTRLPSYERINNALKALKGRCAERDDASPRDGDLIVGGMAYDD